MAGKPGVSVTGDLDPMKELRKKLEQLAGLSATVGYHEAKLVPGSDSLTVPTLAAIQTYGNEHTTKRPFMQRAADAFDQTLQGRAAELIGEVVNDDKAPPLAVQILASELADAVLTELQTAASWAEPNSASTIREKGSAIPLYADHGTLRNELGYAVLRNDSVIAEGKPGGQ